MGVLIAGSKSGNIEGHKIEFPDWSLLQYPRGMHICAGCEEEKQQQKKKKVNVGVCL